MLTKTSIEGHNMDFFIFSQYYQLGESILLTPISTNYCPSVYPHYKSALWTSGATVPEHGCRPFPLHTNNLELGEGFLPKGIVVDWDDTLHLGHWTVRHDLLWHWMLWINSRVIVIIKFRTNYWLKQVNFFSQTNNEIKWNNQLYSKYLCCTGNKPSQNSAMTNRESVPFC